MSQKKGIHFNVSERKILLRIFDIAFVLTALFFVSDFFNFDYFTITSANWSWVFVLILYISIFGTIFELYDLQKSSKMDSILANIILSTSVIVLFYLLTPFFTPVLPVNRLQILGFYVAIIVALSVWRILYITVIASPRFNKKVLVVGETSNISAIIEAFKHADPNYKVVGFINCEAEQTTDDLNYKTVKTYRPDAIHDVIEKEQISEVVVASYNSDSITPEIYRDLITLLEGGFPIKEYTQVYEELTHRVPVQYVGKDFYKYFPFSRNNQNKFYLFFHRLFDMLFSLIGVIGGLVFVPFVVSGNLIANRGPLFYKQERVGKNGKRFNIIKFRTMVTNAETNGAVWAQKNDARVTAFGKFLRGSRLDEIPQFLNILKGDMSLIGPRPERPVFVDELSKVIPFYETRHIVKPGLTGWAQVKVRYGSSVEDSLLKLQYDLFYIKHRGFFLDLNVVIKTFSTVIFFRGQ